MTTLHVFSNRHIKSKVDGINKGDYVYLENSLSRKRWSLYFRANGIDESELNLTYITEEDYFSMTKKFDNIVGNPPYTGSGGGESNIYHQFIRYDIPKISMILPISWFLSNQKDHIIFRNNIIDHGLKKITLYPIDQFPGASVKTANIISEKGYSGKILIEHYDGFTIEVDRRDAKDGIVISKLKSLNSKLRDYGRVASYKILSGKSPVTNRKPTEAGATTKKTSKNCLPTITQLSKNEHSYSYLDSIHDENTDSYRVAFGYLTSGYDTGKTDLGVVSVIPTGVQIARSYRYIMVSSVAEANSLEFYLKSKFARAIFKFTRTSRTVDGPQLKYLPKLNGIVKTDADIYEQFNLTKIEIKYIESLIK